jgi:hypothetical protein
MEATQALDTDYCHTQKSPLDDLLFVVAAAAVLSTWAFHHEPAVVWLLLGFGLMMALAGLCFGHLTVRDEDDHLALRYGPLPVFHKRIPYDTITSVTRGRSSIIDGLGIHYVPGRGWTYNLWGTDCVILHAGKQVIRVGSDDAEALVSFLKEKTERLPAQEGNCEQGV